MESVSLAQPRGLQGREPQDKPALNRGADAQRENEFVGGPEVLGEISHV